MNLKIFNKLLSLKHKEQIVCRLVKGSLYCELVNADNFKQKISFNIPETLNFLEQLKNTNLNENKNIRLKLGEKYYSLNINIKNDQEITIKIIKNQPELKSINHLGFNQRQKRNIKASLKIKKGLILVAGPQSSGKSTTYYSLLSQINNSQKLIYSIEKYPSLNLDGINQLEYQANTFEKIKTSDAEIVGFDQIENQDELKELIYLANSGRLVIATLEKEKAVSALNFITQAGLPFNLVANNLKTILAQNLMRKNCPKCLAKIDINQDWLRQIKKTAKKNFANQKWFSGLGCPHCQYSGKDRLMPVFEIMNISKNASLEPGFEPMICDAVSKANNGLFSPEEISQLLK